MQDISPDFKYVTPTEQKIIQKIIKLNDDRKKLNHFIKYKHKMSDYCYWFILSTIWVDGTEKTDLKRWRALFSTNRKSRASSLMKPSELDAFNKLEDKLIVYRAQSPTEEDRLAYTLSIKQAASFSILKETNEITSYEVKKEDLLCLFLRRGEDEIIILDPSKAVKLKTLPLSTVKI